MGNVGNEVGVGADPYLNIIERGDGGGIPSTFAALDGTAAAANFLEPPISFDYRVWGDEGAVGWRKRSKQGGKRLVQWREEHEKMGAVDLNSFLRN